jgi:hypothetical protein
LIFGLKAKYDCEKIFIFIRVEYLNNERFIRLSEKKWVTPLVRTKKGYTFAIPLDEKECKRLYGHGLDL